MAGFSINKVKKKKTKSDHLREGNYEGAIIWTDREVFKIKDFFERKLEIQE